MKYAAFKQRNASAGFTFIELMILLSVLSILVAWGFPSIEQSIRDNRMAAQNNEMIALLYYARSEAIRRNTEIPVLFIATAEGWDAIIEDPSEEADVEGCVPGQLRCSSNTQVSLTAATSMLTFNNRGYIRGADDAWTTETLFLQHENCIGQNQRRRITVSPTGQVTSCKLPCNSNEACPL